MSKAASAGVWKVCACNRSWQRGVGYLGWDIERDDSSAVYRWYCVWSEVIIWCYLAYRTRVHSILFYTDLTSTQA
jgi:hypothetical protein